MSPKLYQRLADRMYCPTPCRRQTRSLPSLILRPSRHQFRRCPNLYQPRDPFA
jgi:hypothetical protein